MLVIENVDTYYGKIRALREVCLKIEEGEAVALVGPNGAGKTTLMKTISGMIRPRAGKIVFGGMDITHRSSHEIVRVGIVQVPEGRMVYPNFTVWDNLKLGAYIEKNQDLIKKRSEEAFLHFPRLRERLRQKAGTLSGGEQQMLAIARALMSGPRLLLLDEPSLGLAPTLVKETMTIIKQIHGHGTTILLVEQNVHAAFEISHRAYVMEGGYIVLEGETQRLINNEEVKQKYFGE